MVVGGKQWEPAALSPQCPGHPISRRLPRTQSRGGGGGVGGGNSATPSSGLKARNVQYIMIIYIDYQIPAF
jgi:hypothetical protein